MYAAATPGRPVAWVKLSNAVKREWLDKAKAVQTSPIFAAAVAFDGYSRFRGGGKHGSARFHAIAEHGGMACDRHSMVPGETRPASTVAPLYRCQRAACAKLFAQADKTP